MSPTILFVGRHRPGVEGAPGTLSFLGKQHQGTLSSRARLQSSVRNRKVSGGGSLAVPLPSLFQRFLGRMLDRPGVGPVSTFAARQTPETTKLKGWTAGDQASVMADVSCLEAFSVAVISVVTAREPPKPLAATRHLRWRCGTHHFAANGSTSHLRN